jgi:hypothetical protein
VLSDSRWGVNAAAGFTPHATLHANVPNATA